MNPTAVYSKSGKGVQEAAGKTSLLQRADRAVLAAIDGRATLADVAQKVGKSFDAAFQGIISQLDKNGFIREVSAGAAAPAPKPAGPVSKPAPAKPAAKAAPAAEPSFGDLDFSSLGAGKPPSAGKPAAPPPSRPAAPPASAALDQTTVLAKAREEAEAKAAAERERLKKEAEVKARVEMEAKARAEAEQKVKQEAEAKVKAEAEAKVKAAREAAARAAAEAKAKAEAEAKAKVEAERKAREEMERRLEAERKAREEAERKAKEEAERARKEAEEKARREAEELRQKLEAERKAREEAERKAKEEAERARREIEEERKRLEAQRKREEEKRAAEEAARAQAEAAAAAAAAAATAAATPAPKAAKKADSFADSLMADLESFTSREDEERKGKEDAERKAKAEAQRHAREEAERQAKEEAERRRQAEEEERRLADEARRVREEEERRAQEEERRKREAEEIRRKAEAATAAAMAKEGRPVAKAAEEDIPISDDDLDMAEVKREQAALAKSKAKEEKKEKEREKERERAAKARSAETAAATPRRPVKWGRPVAITLGLVLVGAVAAAHIMPLGTGDYERAASEALGRPVKIGSASLWLFSGLPQVRFKDVRVGDAKIAQVNASGMPGAIFGDKKEFNEIEIDGFTLPQEAIGDALFAKVRADNFSVSHISIKSLQLPGPATLPKDLHADIALDGSGKLQTATVRGPDGLVAKLTPKNGAIDFEVLAAGFTLPIAPQLTLSNFVMKGNATPRGMTISEWGGAIFNGGISGTANVSWGGGWTVDGVLTVHNINAAVFAPALLSSGSGEGTAKFSMSAADPAGLVSASRLDGNFTVSKGTLGSFDLARAIQGGKAANGSTQFAEMNGQATYDRGTVALRNVTIGAGALNAGASADIARNGALSGRIVADMKTASQVLRATLLIGGTVKEPQVRN